MCSHSSPFPPQIRRGFIRKVYGILCAQLLLTMAIMTPFLIEASPVREYARNNSWMYWTGFGLTMVRRGARWRDILVRLKNKLKISFDSRRFPKFWTKNLLHIHFGLSKSKIPNKQTWLKKKDVDQVHGTFKKWTKKWFFYADIILSSF